MNEKSASDALKSPLPSERMSAVLWVIQHPKSKELEREVLAAASREQVPRIRSMFSAALRTFAQPDQPEAPAITFATVDTSESAQILNELAGIISHETQAVIGRVRYAANKEVSDFSSSQTNRALDALVLRINGLSSLAGAHRLPSLEITSLNSFVLESVSAYHMDSLFLCDFDESKADLIASDIGLLSLIISNALQNAIDASSELADQKNSILVTTRLAERSFWLTISNRFSGASFNYAAVSATGRSSKRGHRGLGTRIMQIAADRLKYEFDLNAAGSTATFSLRGQRFG